MNRIARRLRLIVNSFIGRRVIRWFLRDSPWMLQRKEVMQRCGLNYYAELCHQASAKAGWWTDLKTGESLLPTRNKGELMMLMVTELAEGFEGVRKDLWDDKLPHRKMVEVEMADAVIRIFDFCGAFNLDIEGAVREKMAFNAQREDHKPENRRKQGGKAF